MLGLISLLGIWIFVFKETSNPILRYACFPIIILHGIGILGISQILIRATYPAVEDILNNYTRGYVTAFLLSFVLPFILNVPQEVTRYVDRFRF